MLLALLLIVGGSLPSDHNYDAVANLRFSHAASWHCSGVLVGDQTLLTARHCVDYANVSFIAGFNNGESREVVSVYFPSSGDVALLALADAPKDIAPIPLLFDYVTAGSSVVLSGWGHSANTLAICVTAVTFSDPNSYIQFPPASSGCGVGNHDSGGAVIVREGIEYRVVGVITGTTDANNLSKFKNDPAFTSLARPWSVCP